MNLIIGIVILFIIGLAMTAFEAVGGWPGVFLILTIIVVGVFLITNAMNRNEAIRALRAKPGRVSALTEEAGELVDTIDAPVKAALDELEALRAPLFWERFEECCRRMFVANDNLDRAASEAEEYGTGARKYNLIPRDIAVDDGPLREKVEALYKQLERLQNEAMVLPDFGVVFEQRRQGLELLAHQQAMHADLAETARATLEAAEQASAEARDARWAAKRASGDWF